MTKSLVILGACGVSRDTYWVVRESYPETKVVFVSDLMEEDSIDMAGDSVPVVRDWDFSRLRQACGDPNSFKEFVCGMGYPNIKRVMVEKALGHGLRPAPTLISHLALVRPSVRIGVGGVIQPRSTLLTDIDIGDFVLVHGATYGHDVRVGNYVSSMPYSCLGGYVTLGDGVFQGIGAVVKHRTRVAPWVIIGTNASVVKDIDEEAITVAGTPARRLTKGSAAT